MINQYDYDINTPGLKKFFDTISKDGYLNTLRFYEAVKKKFPVFFNELLLAVATFFDENAPKLNYRAYGELMRKVLN